MKTFAAIVLLAAALVGPAAEAKAKKSDVKKAEPSQAAPSSKGGSWDVRSRSHAWVAGGGGNIVGGINGGDVEGAYVSSPTLQFGGGAAMGSRALGVGSSEEGGLTSSVTNDKLTGLLVFGKARFFVGNSFNVSGIVSYRRIEVAADIDVTDTATNVSGGLSVDVVSTSFTAGIAIGNHWAFDSGLTLGADWIGYNQPLVSTAKSSTTRRGVLTSGGEDLSDSVQSMAEKLGKTAHAQLLVGTIGFLF